MLCFQIILTLHDHVAKVYEQKTQYFRVEYHYTQQEKIQEAIYSALKWVHWHMKKSRKKYPHLAVEELLVWGWDIASPELNGEIKTTKHFYPTLRWSFERGLIETHMILSSKQKRRVANAALLLNKYRHVRSEIIIEQIGNEIMDGIDNIPF